MNREPASNCPNDCRRFSLSHRMGEGRGEGSVSTISGLPLAVTVGLLISFFTITAGQAQEQWVPIGPPSWTNTTIHTVGGVTYFTGSASLLACHRIGLGPVTRSGTNLVLTANEERWTGTCVLCFECYYNATNVSVLGALPPGGYLLTILWNPPFGPDLPMTFSQIPFSVPSSRTLTLSSWTDHLTGNFHLAVQGVPNASYVIQASNDASNWTSLATNFGAPFVWSEPLTPQVTNRFYRTWIIGL